MKLSACFLAALSFLGACQSQGASILGDKSQVLEYPAQEGRYAIVVVLKEGMDEQEALDLARQKAAELTVKKGFRYFTIERETKVQVLQSNKDWPDSKAFPGNLYEELIIEKDFTRERVANAPDGGTTLRPGLKLVIRCEEKSQGETSIDACTLTDCQK